jgi:hypothetical protein
MKTTFNAEFFQKDGAINTKRAIEAGHDARTTAIRDIARWIGSTAKAAINCAEFQRP